MWGLFFMGVSMFSYFTVAATPLASFVVNPPAMGVTETSSSIDSGTASALVNTNEAAAASDLESGALQASSAIAETSTGTSSTSQTTASAQSVIEAINADSSSLAAMSATHSVLDAGNAISIEVGSLAASASRTEASSALDASTRTLSASAASTETSTAIDVLSETMYSLALIIESAGASDSLTAALSALAASADTMNLTSVVSAFAAIPAFITEETKPRREQMSLLGSSAFGEMSFSGWVSVIVDNDTQSSAYNPQVAVFEVSNAIEEQVSIMVAVAQILEAMNAQDLEFLLKYPVDPLYITEAKVHCFLAIRAAIKTVKIQ